jgi:hypothetical protein
VDSAVNHIKILGILLSDGSNFREWFRAMEMISQDILEDRHFYQVLCVRPIPEKMAKRILLRVVNLTLANELWTQPHVFAMMSLLRSRFTTFRKAHMLQKWRELSRIPVDMHCNPAVVATQYKRCLAELLNMDVWIDIDTVGPLMFHDAIAQGTPLRAEFD